jgi:DNA-binding NarL/FixJ family response regulator
MKTGLPSAICVKIVHRNRIFRECLARVLSAEGHFLVGQVDHTAADYLNAILLDPPQVILVDLNLPDQLALSLTQHLRDRVPCVRVVLLTHSSSHDDLVECFAAGAHGGVLEESSLQDLREAIEKVASGEAFCSPGMVHSMFRRLAQAAQGNYRHDPGHAAQLTPRELEIVRLISEHLSNKQIARRLSVSLYTVKNHVHNIVEKLQVTGRYEAVDYARKQRWLGTASLLVPGRREN